jgi:predicted GNAT family acetyltransferase
MRIESFAISEIREKDRRTISACPVVYFLRKSDDKKDQRVKRRIKNIR